MNIGVFIVLFLFITTAFAKTAEEKAYNEPQKRKVRNAYINCVSIMFILFTGLRNLAVGPDTYAYYKFFNIASEAPLAEHINTIIDYINNGNGKDVGYPLFTKLFSLILDSYRAFLFFVAILFFGAFALLLKKTTKNIDETFIAFLIFDALFLIYAFSSLRQDIAIALTMFSMIYIRKRKLVHFLLLILLGAFIHKSILLFLPYYWIARMRNVRTLSFLTISILPVLFILAQPIALLMATASGDDHYLIYTEAKSTGSYTYTACLLCCFVFYIMMIKKLNRTYPKHHWWTNTIFLTVALCPLSWIDTNLMRLQLYFSIYLPIIIGVCISVIKQKPAKNTVEYIVIAIMVLLILKTAPTYDFFWNEMSLGDNYTDYINTVGI